MSIERGFLRRKALEAFTILELLVVIAIIGILLGMVQAFSPSAEPTATKALIMNLGISIDQYRNSFYVYPHSHANDYLDDGGNLIGDAGAAGLYWILTRKDMVQRDGKYVDQLWQPDSNFQTQNDGSDVYFLDAWSQRLVYYSGAELYAGGAVGSTHLVIPNWLRASGKISSGTPSGRYRADDFYFLGSAGTDSVFQFNVVQGGSDPHDPSEYTYAPSYQGAGPSNQISGGGDDDIWNQNLSGF